MKKNFVNKTMALKKGYRRWWKQTCCSSLQTKLCTDLHRNRYSGVTIFRVSVFHCLRYFRQQLISSAGAEVARRETSGADVLNRLQLVLAAAAAAVCVCVRVCVTELRACRQRSIENTTVGNVRLSLSLVRSIARQWRQRRRASALKTYSIPCRRGTYHAEERNLSSLQCTEPVDHHYRHQRPSCRLVK